MGANAASTYKTQPLDLRFPIVPPSSQAAKYSVSMEGSSFIATLNDTKISNPDRIDSTMDINNPSFSPPNLDAYAGLLPASEELTGDQGRSDTTSFQVLPASQGGGRFVHGCITVVQSNTEIPLPKGGTLSYDDLYLKKSETDEDGRVFRHYTTRDQELNVIVVDIPTEGVKGEYSQQVQLSYTCKDQEQADDIPEIIYKLPTYQATEE